MRRTRNFFIAVCAAIALMVGVVDKACDSAHINDIKDSNSYNILNHAHHNEPKNFCTDDQGVTYEC